eukprot:1294945-Prymnesium_polylepis.1
MGARQENASELTRGPRPCRECIPIPPKANETRHWYEMGAFVLVNVLAIVHGVPRREAASRWRWSVRSADADG